MSVSVEISTLRSKGEYHFGQETGGETDSLLNQLHFLDKTASFLNPIFFTTLNPRCKSSTKKTCVQ